MKRLVLFLAMSAVAWGAEVQPGQVFATVRSDQGDVSVTFGGEGQVLLECGALDVSLTPEQALAAANWIKEQTSESFQAGPVAFHRETDGFRLTISSAGAAPLTLLMEKPWAYQLAGALAAGRKSATEP